MNEPSESKQEDIKALADQNAQLRILMVEDDAAILRLNAEVLSKGGYVVDTAENGAVAWEMLQQGGYDLLITDNSMPLMSGVQLLKKLQLSHMALPAIMATGALPEADFRAQSCLQPPTVLLKPYGSEDLLVVVRRVLGVADSPAK